MDLFNQIADITKPVPPAVFFGNIGKQTRLIPDNEMPAVTTNTCNFFRPISNVQELLNLIYANGGNRPAVIVKHDDGGHGWLQVPISIVHAAGIKNKISEYSYMDHSNIYLEEDCDMSLFLNAIGIEAGSEINKLFFQNLPREYNEYTPIRRMKSYKA